jgi:polysaccharide biosynthesis transport protein
VSADNHMNRAELDPESSLDLGEVYRILFAGRWFLLACIFVATVAGLVLNQHMAYRYRATATAMIVTENPWEAGLMLDGRGSVPSFSVADQMQILESRRLLKAVAKRAAEGPYADRLHLLGFEEDVPPSSEEDVIETLLENLSVRQKQNSNVLAISLEAGSGFEAAYLTNLVAQSFVEQNQELSRAEYTELTTFLKKQLDQVAARLSDAEVALTRFKEGAKLSALDVETAAIVDQSASAQAELNRINLEWQSNDVALKNLRRQYLQGRTTLVEDLENLSTATITQLTNEIAEKQARIANVRAKQEAGWKAYVERLEGELRLVKTSLKGETRKLSAREMKSADPLGTMQQIFERIVDLDVENRALAAGRTAQRAVVAEFEARLSELPEASLAYARYTRDVEINEKLYRLLMEKHEENKAISAGMIGNVRLLDSAEVPRTPVRPNKRLNLIVSILVGVLMGVGMAFIYHLTNTRIVTPEDLKRLHLDVMGSIPSINTRKLRKVLKKKRGGDLSTSESEKVNRRLITHFSPKSPISEAYRSLRTTLLTRLQEVKHEAPVVLVTSSTTQEGKSLTSANLAVTLAQTGRKTVVIDADLRRPTTHKNFSIERNEGLSDILMGRRDLASVITQTDVENLFVVSAGPIPPNPAELLAGSRMRELFQELREQFDFVLVDSPPIVPVTDPTVLAPFADAVLLVVRSAQSHRRELSEALSRLAGTGSTPTGMVLNDYNLKAIYGSYYYYHHYYNRYYYYGETGKKRSRRVGDEMHG